MFHRSVGPLGLSLRPNLATARAREGQSPACFPCFWLFSLFRFVRLFSVLLGNPLGPKCHPKTAVCSPMAATRPQNATFFCCIIPNRRTKERHIEHTIQGRHDERRNDKNSETANEETTTRHRPSVIIGLNMRGGGNAALPR